MTVRVFVTLAASSSSISAFRELLNDAKGSSEFIIAVILDIRGFSSLANKVESVETAAFLRRIYIKMIDNYFSNASFVKPTGDGLLLAFPYEESSLSKVASDVLKSCFDCLSGFANLCDGDDMIDFDTPDKLGIGISKGAATKLVSNGVIIDYSGRPFNIASRLMELARPSGMVIEWKKFRQDIIPQEVLGTLSIAEVYLKGVNEDALTKVYYTKDHTIIPIEKTEMPKIEWVTDKTTKKLSAWKTSSDRYRIHLSAQPIDETKIMAECYYITSANKLADMASYQNTEFSYKNHGGTPVVVLDIKEALDRATENGLLDNEDLTFNVKYATSKKS